MTSFTLARIQQRITKNDSEEGKKGLKKNASSVYLGLVFNIHWLFWWHQQGSKAFKSSQSNSDLVLCSHVKNNIACSMGQDRSEQENKRGGWINGARKQRALHRTGQKQLYRVNLSSLQAFSYAKPFGEGSSTEPSENYLEKLFVATRERTTSACLQRIT